ncbi:hypothetical protein PROFUN_10197 [Planoprotostelium fungivorum]|uniref:Uncharacterized protein n=1 Tax=Planoprotostelium fungivorum TaxID=1890364 RepID=A0A2P6MQ55_9EUKA|nr:hypothetical protein PROFUN_10197 [Planoprotostelium fungivorum]
MSCKARFADAKSEDENIRETSPDALAERIWRREMDVLGENFIYDTRTRINCLGLGSAGYIVTLHDVSGCFKQWNNFQEFGATGHQQGIWNRHDAFPFTKKIDAASIRLLRLIDDCPPDRPVDCLAYIAIVSETTHIGKL